MTVGQRIAQKRKELGLSQEALGEQLGVSRQAIYKWESDSSLPEIDKLIALSKIFSVPVGWLLGVEEPHSEDLSSSEDCGDLTPAQLAMVEEIVRRYQQAQPISPPRKKWPRVLAVLLLLFVFFRLFSQLDTLQEDSARMQGIVNQVNRQVETLTYSIPSQVEQALEQMNSFTVEHSVEIAGADLAANTVTFEVRVVPKTYTEGMTVFAQVDCENTLTATVPLSGDRTGYRGSLTCPLTDGNISLSVTFVTGEKQETQKLKSYSNLYTSTFPANGINAAPLFFDVEENDLMTAGREFAIEPTKFFSGENSMPQSEAVQMRLGLFQGNTLVCWLEQLADQPESFRGDWENFLFFRITADQQFDRSATYCFALVITDEFGRELVCSDIPVWFDPECGENGDWTWVEETKLRSTDPSDWIY